MSPTSRILALESTRAFKSFSSSLSFFRVPSIFGHPRRRPQHCNPSTSLDCATPATEFSDTEKPFFHEKNPESFMWPPWMVVRNPPCNRIDAPSLAHGSPTSVLTRPHPCFVPILPRLTKGSDTMNGFADSHSTS